MMPRWRRTTACERASGWISLELDGEIAVLERAALARHLGRCDRCRAQSTELVALTTQLRGAPAVAPQVSVTPVGPFRRQPRRIARAGVVALVATVAVVAGLLTFPRPAKLEPSAIGFVTLHEQERFTHMHTSTEPVLFLVATPPPGSFAERALR